MTEKKQSATHILVKGKKTHGKPGGKTAARALAGTKRAAEGKKTPAKAAAQKLRQPGAAALQPAAAADPGPAKRGLAQLKEEARNMMEKDVKHILKGLKEKARKGSTNDFKLLFDLAGLTEPKPAENPDDESCVRGASASGRRRGPKSAENPDDESCSAAIRDLMTQPEYQVPAEDGGNTRNPQPGDFQTARATAEETVESTKEIA